MTLEIGIILGSTRPGRNGEAVAQWVLDKATGRDDAHYSLVDLRDYALPHLDEPISASSGIYQNPHTREWAATIARFDGFVFVTPEYNHSLPGALKNALDFVYAEWNDKAAGIVSYGGAGGVRAAEHLRLVAGELQIADVRQQVALPLSTEFDWSQGPQNVRFTPSEASVTALDELFRQVTAWAGALATLRGAAQTPAA